MTHSEAEQPSLFLYSQTTDFVPVDRPLRQIPSLVDAALDSMNDPLTVRYSCVGRPGRRPERLIRPLLARILYPIGWQRRLVEQLPYNMPFAWFAGPSLNNAVYTRRRLSRTTRISDLTPIAALDAVCDPRSVSPPWRGSG